MEKKLLSNLRRLSVCLLLPFIALQARAQASTVANVTDGYYNILTSDGKYVNVAGRKTVNFVSGEAAKTKAGTVEDGAVQLSFFQLDDPTLSAIRDYLKDADLNNMTPMQAFDLLRKMKGELGL